MPRRRTSVCPPVHLPVTRSEPKLAAIDRWGHRVGNSHRVLVGKPVFELLRTREALTWGRAASANGGQPWNNLPDWMSGWERPRSAGSDQDGKGLLETSVATGPDAILEALNR